MEYIQSNKDDARGCGVHASVASERGEESERVLARSELGFVVLNKYPYNPGHVMVDPEPPRRRPRGARR